MPRIYNKVREAAAKLDGADKLKPRREASSQLRTILSNVESRSRLEQEAAAGGDKRKALAAVWGGLVLLGSINAAERNLQEKKAKIESRDVTIPWDFLKLDPNVYLYVCSEEKYVVNLVNYCLHALADDKAIEAAEEEMLQMLSYICSKRELVAHLSPLKEISHILTELQKRIGHREQNCSPSIQCQAAMAFSGLIATCQKLGMMLEILFPSCMQMIVDWCKYWQREHHSYFGQLPTDFKHMMQAAASLQTMCPDLAVSWMKRSGQSLLTFARRSAASAKGAEEGNALCHYWLAHLHICKTAGRLEGLLPGDLGSLASASLDKALLQELWDLEFARLVAANDQSPKVELTSFRAIKHRIKAISEGPMELRERLGLELCANLIASLQRLFLCDAEWDEVEEGKRVPLLLSEIPPFIVRPEDDLMEPPSPKLIQCSPEVVMRSPWFENVVRPLILVDAGTDNSGMTSSQDSDLLRSGSASTTKEYLSTSDVELSWIRQHFSTDSRQLPKKNVAVVVLLKLICAFAETFPLGECWTSSASQYWYAFEPNDALQNDVVHCYTCSPADMALVVRLVADVLENSGRADGSVETQLWALLCLTRLTETSSFVTFKAERHRETCHGLSAAWQRVWRIIFCTHFRYLAYTASASFESMGEVVLVLLTEIVRQGCTENPGCSFVYPEQEYVWQLPVYKNAETISVPAAFDLLNQILHRVGLNDDGRDAIDGMEPVMVPAEISQLDRKIKATRRYRLLCFCLRSLRSLLVGEHGGMSKDRERFAVLCACIATLAAGKAVHFSSTFSHEASIVSRTICDPDGTVRTDLKRRFRVTRIRNGARKAPYKNLNQSGGCIHFDCLWDFGSLDEFQKYDPMDFDDDHAVPLGEEVAHVVSTLLSEKQKTVKHADFVSKSDSSALHHFVLSYLQFLLHGDYESVDGNDMSPLQTAFVMKAMVTVAVLHQEPVLSSNLHKNLFETPLTTSLEKLLPCVSTPTDDTPAIVTNLLQIIHALRIIHTSGRGTALPDGISACLRPFVEECMHQLRLFSDSGDVNAASAELCSKVNQCDPPDRAHISFEESDEEGYTYDVGTKRKRPSSDRSGRSSRQRTSLQASSTVAQEPPTFLVACRLASILLLLTPSWENVCFVSGALAFHSSEASSEILESCFLDFAGACHCLNLLCCSSIMPRDQDFNNCQDSPFISLCIRLIRQIRTAADPGSKYFLFGNHLCADVVSEGIQSSRACKEIAAVILSETSHNERRALRWRSPFHALQLSLSRKMYIRGSRRFKRTFEERLLEKLALPSLLHLSASVRKEAVLTMGALLGSECFLDEEKILEQIVDMLPAIHNNQFETDFKEWRLRSMDYHSQHNDLSGPQTVAWEDVCLSLRMCVIQCLGIISGASSNHEVSQRYLFDLLSIAAEQPALESICLISCERVAFLRGFAGAERMTRANCRYLCHKWLERGHDLRGLPLVMTAPDLLLSLLRRRRADTIATLRDDVSRNYIRRVSHVFVPAILAQFYTNEDSDANGCKRRVVDLLRQACKLIEASQDGSLGTKKTATLLIRENFHDICAVFEPMKLSSSPEYRKLNETVFAYLNEKLPDRSRDNMPVVMTVRALLKTFGDAEDQFGNHMSEEILFQTITDLSKRRRERDPAASLFQQIGGSASEFLTHGKYWLEMSPSTQSAERRWQVLEFLCRSVMKEVALLHSSDIDLTELCACIVIMLDILRNVDLRHLRSRCLELLQAMVECILKSLTQLSVHHKLDFMVGYLLQTILSVHKEQQKIAMEKSNEAYALKDYKSRCQMGLVPSDADGDAWGWDSFARTGDLQRNNAAFASWDVENETDLKRTLELTHDIIEAVIDNWEVLSEASLANIGILVAFDSCPSPLESLAGTMNPKFHGQTLVRGFLKKCYESEMTTDVETTVSNFLSRTQMLKPSQMTEDSRGSMGLSCKGMTTRATLLVDELKHLRMEIEKHTNDASPNNAQWCRLAHKLFSLCGIHYPLGIQQEASRCLGELGPSVIEELSRFDLETLLNESIEEDISEEAKEISHDFDDEMMKIKAESLEMLGELIMSTKTRTALVALEAIKELRSFVSDEEWQCLLKEIPSEVCRLRLSQFPPSVPTSATRSAQLPEPFIGCLCTNIVAAENNEWCWNRDLWQFSSSVGYDDWIRRLVCAILLCCYSVENSDHESTLHDSALGEDNFFRYCIKVCATDVEFAACVFPGIVLDLLRKSSQAEDSLLSNEDASVVRDTWVCEPDSSAVKVLSDCFSSLIGSFTATFNSAGTSQDVARDTRSILLAVQTLDLLRQVSQYRFLSSSQHKRNSRSEGSTKSHACSQLPLGTVLRIDGLQVVQACIFTKRFASALLYAEMCSDRLHRTSTERNGSASEAIDSLGKRSCDISGYPTSRASSGAEACLVDLLHDCFHGLGEYENSSAVSTQRAAIHFLDEKSRRVGDMFKRDSSASCLRMLDAQVAYGQFDSRKTLRIARCMGELGLRNTMRSFLDGIVSKWDRTVAADISDSDMTELRESHTLGTLRDIQWGSQSRCEELPSLSQLLPHGDSKGFYESISTALSSFLRDDIDTFSDMSVHARKVLLNQMFSNVSDEFSLLGTLDYAEKMEVLNNVDKLKRSISRDRGPQMAHLRAQIKRASIESFDHTTDLEKSLTGFYEFSSSMTEAILRVLGAKYIGSDSEIHELLVSHLRHVTRIARTSGRPEVAVLSLQRLQSALKQKWQGEVNRLELMAIRLEEATTMESSGYAADAILYAKNVADYLTKFETVSASHRRFAQEIKADALCKCGLWISHKKLESPKVVLDKYLSPAQELARQIAGESKSTKSQQRLVATHILIGELAVSVYNNTKALVSSESWKKQGRDLARRFLRVKELAGDSLKSADIESRMLRYRPEIRGMEQAAEERQKEHDAMSVWLHTALVSFCGALSTADTSVDLSRHAFRLLSLWFSNSDDSEVCQILRGRIDQIPSFRLVPLTYQVFSRIATATNERDNEFQELIAGLIKRMCLHHPYHCIVPLLALKNGDQVGNDSGSDSYIRNAGSEKVQAVKPIVESLRRPSAGYEYVSQLMKSYETLTDAYVELALTKTMKDKKEIPKETLTPFASLGSNDVCLDKIIKRSLRNQLKPCILTKPPKLQPNADYGRGKTNPEGSELIEKFYPKFKVPSGGITKPKIVLCYGETTKTAYQQLVKGNDDIRQDAVTQQIFEQVNALMKRRSREGSKGRVASGGSRITRENLKIVTYRCVPLSPNSGVLEWVHGTLPFGYFIVDRKAIGAHSRYCPGEWGHSDCSKYYVGANQENKREAFDIICQNFSPVFRFFFLEKFSFSSQAWHKAKMNYTRSCAVASMVGHVLGLGDRHIYNILLQEKTGEVVHIDFGYIFEQAKLLHTPEQVPFRLTRNVVDGMGPCGTAGTFTRACETTLNVLRENAQVVVAILEAVIADPLYRWESASLPEKHAAGDRGRSHKKTRLVQDEKESTSEEDNDEPVADAGERAIARVLSKLQGHEEGSAEVHSVEGQVQMLINQATDGDNLCRMYHGWAPWI